MKRKITIEFDNLTQIKYLSNLLTKEADRLQDDLHELCDGSDPFMEGGHDSHFYKYFHDIEVSKEFFAFISESEFVIYNGKKCILKLAPIDNFYFYLC